MDDFSKLDFEELVRFRELQRKMRVATGSIEGYEALTVDELKTLERFIYKMKGEPYPWDQPTATYCHWCGHAVGAVTHEKSIVPGVYCSEECLENGQRWHQGRVSGVTAAVTSQLEPVAIAPAAAPAAPAATATAPPAVKPVRPAEDVLSAARQLDGLMRFGYDLPAEPR